MKIKSFTWVVVASIAACLLSGTAFAGKASQADVFKKELKSVAVPEMGAKAAQLVSEANAKARESTAVAVVSAAIELKPVAAVAVVSAIARENPEVAPAVAARAAALLPKEAAAIARAAAGAAPAQAGKIVFAVCKAVPTKYSEVATAVAQAVPYASKEIVAAVMAALPSLKPFVDRADTNLAGRSKSVGSIMAQTESMVANTAQLTGSTPEKILTAPALPAYAALPLTPPGSVVETRPGGGSTTDRTTTGAIPPGGVIYSSP